MGCGFGASKSPKVAPAPAHPGAPWGTSPEVHPGEPKSAYRTFGCAYGARTVRVPYANLLLGVFHRGSSCGFDNQSFKKGIFSRRFLFFEGGAENIEKDFSKNISKTLEKKNWGRGRPPRQGARPGAGGAQEQLLRRPHPSTSWWTIHTSKSPKVTPAPVHPGAPWGTSPQTHLV